MEKIYRAPGKGKQQYQARVKFWQEVIEDQQASGLTAKEFYLKYGLKKHQLGDWKYRLRNLGLIKREVKNLNVR